MMKENITRIVIGILLAIFIPVSIFLISPKLSKPETYKSTIQKLDEKRTTVLEMTGAASAASLALAAVPGDATTPIADKIMDMAGYFIIILSVLILEKYILTLAGYLTFTWLIPIACGLFIINLFAARRGITHLAIKILFLGLSFVLIVPVSVRLTEVIEKANKDSISTSMDEIKEIRKEAEGTVDEAESDLKEETETESSNPLDTIRNVKEKFDQLKEDTKNTFQDAADSVGMLSEQALKKAQETVDDFVEVVVIMLVTSCGIPIVTLFVFVFVIKSFLSVDLSKLREDVSS